MKLRDKSREYHELRKKMILDATKEIIDELGMEKLTIRTIAKKVDLSPSVIYHYFKNKDEIIYMLLGEGYSQIYEAVSTGNRIRGSNLERLSAMSKNYIYKALDFPDEFLLATLNKGFTRVSTRTLFKGASRVKPVLSELYSCLRGINKDNSIEESIEETEIKAQLIATSALGLIIKIIIEKDMEISHRDKLINYFCYKTVIKIASGDKENE